uniref:VSG n=1 Tax=Trypanosoma vivax (strain Y486) TaxID=1055687 RepID=G0W2X3_TRYVY|nr:VSG [Trypanosoma vivax Y486]
MGELNITLRLGLLSLLLAQVVRDAQATAGDDANVYSALCGLVTVAAGVENTADGIDKQVNTLGLAFEEAEDTKIVAAFVEAHLQAPEHLPARKEVESADNATSAALRLHVAKAVEAGKRAKIKTAEAKKKADQAVFGPDTDKTINTQGGEQTARNKLVSSQVGGKGLAADISALCAQDAANNVCTRGENYNQMSKQDAGWAEAAAMLCHDSQHAGTPTASTIAAALARAVSVIATGKVDADLIGGTSATKINVDKATNTLAYGVDGNKKRLKAIAWANALTAAGAALAEANIALEDAKLHKTLAVSNALNIAAQHELRTTHAATTSKKDAEQQAQAQKAAGNKQTAATTGAQVTRDNLEGSAQGGTQEAQQQTQANSNWDAGMQQTRNVAAMVAASTLAHLH